MPGSKYAVASHCQFLVREASREDLGTPTLLSQYFAFAGPGIGRDLETTALRALMEANHNSGRTELLAEGIDGSVGCLISEEKPWDSSMLHVPTRNLVILASPPRGQVRHQIISHLLEHWLRECPRASEGVVTTRIAADDSALLQALEENSFHLLVPMVTLGKSLEKVKFAVPLGCGVSDAEPMDIDQIEKIAETAFLWGRFAVDSSVPVEDAKNIHRTWARNCCLGAQAKHVLVARKKNEVLGFIAMKFQMAGSVEVGSIELIATSEASRGMGLGRALVQAGCNWLSAKAKYVIVRTELTNIPALHLYEAQSFRVLNGSLHLSRPAPACLKYST